MHAFFELFAFGEIGYFAVAGLIALFLLFVDYEADSAPFWSTVFLGTLIWLSYDAFKYINFRGLVTIAIGYITVGIIYSIYKWFSRVSSIIEENSTILKSHNVSSLETLIECLEKLNYGNNDHKTLSNVCEDINPKLNKRLFYGWIILWPWSVTWNLTHNFFEFIWGSIKGQYKRIVDSLLRKNMGIK
jgi:hypothetical protein